MLPAPRPVSLVDDPLFDTHVSRGYHPERPERLGAARRAIARCESAGTEVRRLHPRDATEDELARAHAPAYLEALARVAGKHAALDADTYVAPGSVAAARRAAGGAIALVDALMTAPDAGARPVGVGLLRPPGHHATRERGMGFCLLNNAAVAAYHALASGLERVAIIDWDVHHGNGTQDIFWSEPRVLYVSLHQWPLYPSTGSASEIGVGDGAGTTLNVPLSGGADDAVYAAAFDDLIVPALEWFAPELVLVSAGFDAHARDPLAAMRLTEHGYGWMAAELARVARGTAADRIGLLLEGGYDLGALEGSLAASIQAMTSGTAPRPEGRVGDSHRGELDEARRLFDSRGASSGAR